MYYPTTTTKMEGIIDYPATPAVIDPITQQFETIVGSLTGFRTQFMSVQQQLRALEKNVAKELKSFRKEAEKKKLKSVNRKPSGFAKPSHISAELAAFMQIDANKMVARTEVTQFIIKYISDNNLQNAANRKIILPDAVLQELLSVEEADVLTYFNLQRYMNRHFVKATTNGAAAAAPVQIDGDAPAE